MSSLFHTSDSQPSTYEQAIQIAQRVVNAPNMMSAHRDLPESKYSSYKTVPSFMRDNRALYDRSKSIHLSEKVQQLPTRHKPIKLSSTYQQSWDPLTQKGINNDFRNEYPLRSSSQWNLSPQRKTLNKGQQQQPRFLRRIYPKWKHPVEEIAGAFRYNRINPKLTRTHFKRLQSRPMNDKYSIGRFNNKNQHVVTPIKSESKYQHIPYEDHTVTYGNEYILDQPKHRHSPHPSYNNQKRRNEDNYVNISRKLLSIVDENGNRNVTAPSAVESSETVHPIGSSTIRNRQSLKVPANGNRTSTKDKSTLNVKYLDKENLVHSSENDFQPKIILRNISSVHPLHFKNA